MCVAGGTTGVSFSFLRARRQGAGREAEAGGLSAPVLFPACTGLVALAEPLQQYSSKKDETKAWDPGDLAGLILNLPKVLPKSSLLRDGGLGGRGAAGAACAGAQLPAQALPAYGWVPGRERHLPLPRGRKRLYG